MKITVHRGNQIGGCITEILTESSRLFIDMGDNLPGNHPLSSLEKERMVCDLFADNQRTNQGVVYTHSHPDHTGMMQYVPAQVPQYMSKGTRDVKNMVNDLLLTGLGLERKTLDPTCEERIAELDEREKEYQSVAKVLQQAVVWEKPEPGLAPASILIGDISVTPYFVSHSAYDSHMLLIEAEGKRILHTGDFRGHGYLSSGLLPMLKKYVGQVDALITEGTMLGREDICLTEMEISRRMAAVMDAFKYVVVLTSATDIERLAAIQCAAKKHKRMVLGSSEIVNRAIEYFNDNAKYGDNDLFEMQSERVGRFLGNHNHKRALKELKRDGFVLIANPSSLHNVKRFTNKFDPGQPLLIYSCWDGYYKDDIQAIENPLYKLFRDSFSNVVDLHTSGHADTQTIAKVIETVNPREAILCIHKEASQSLSSLPISEALKSKIVEENIFPDWIGYGKIDFSSQTIV